jgi:hypothetical protein
MDWLIVIAQMCQVSAGGGDGNWYIKRQAECQRQLIECVLNENRSLGISSKPVSDCVLKRAKGELK